MRKFLVLFIFTLSCIGICDAQRYIVDSRKGSEKFSLAQKIDGEWTQAKPLQQIALKNGYEFESINGEDYPIVFEYEGKPYIVTKYYTSNAKTVKLLDSQGKKVEDIKKYRGNTFFGKFYFSGDAGYLALICGGASVLFLIVALQILIHREKGCPALFRWMFGVPLAIIAIIEVIAFFTVGREAYWWVDPDIVGYIYAFLWLVPYSLVVLMQVVGVMIYRSLIPEGADTPIFDNILVGIMWIGVVVAAIAFIQVALNFVVAFAFLLFMGLLASPISGVVHRDSDGNKYVNTGLGRQKVD